MILDKNLVFSDAQAETSVAAQDSTNVIDTGIADSNLGAGTPLWVNVQVNTTVTSSGAATVSVALHDSSDGSTYAAIWTSAAYAKATLVAGFVMMSIPLPSEHERYLKVVYTIATSVLTAGAFDAWIGNEAISTH